MKITEHLLQLSGVQYETNSNIYAIQYDGGVILIDCGYRTEQWERMTAQMKEWGMDPGEITHVFLTHSHFDHAGNVWRINELGAKVHASPVDADRVENGNPEMEELFGAPWTCGKVDVLLREGERFSFPGGVKLDVLETPGHSSGSLTYRIQVDGKTALCTGDMFFVTPRAPLDAVDVELGYMGSRDFSMESFLHSLKRLEKENFDLLLPGHYYFYGGENAARLFGMAIEKAEKGAR